MRHQSASDLQPDARVGVDAIHPGASLSLDRFPDNLARLQHERGISDRQLAARVGVHRRRIYELRHGLRVTLPMLERIAAALHCRAPELLGAPPK
jgi:DNA-binding Xre family transcriptional regulator